MATLDLPALLTAIQALETEVQQVVFGLEDLLLTHLTTDERTQLQTLTDTYRRFDATTAALGANARALEALGYPTLPTLQVSGLLAAKLAAEIADQQAALALIHGPVEAVSGTLNFEAPIEKQ
jgi:hypothetical protein